MQAEAYRSRYRTLVFIAWFLTLDLIMFGAFVRLTDSGLGCPDWPGCYGNFSPVGASDHIKNALMIMPQGPVSFTKAWIEMIHRYVGSVLGLMIIAITVMAWRFRKILNNTATVATVTLIAICIQGAFGAWTVTHKLMPIIVTSHLIGGMLVLSLMTWLAAREKNHAPVQPRSTLWLPWLFIGLILLLVQIALGGWVSTNYAALACLDFPTCHGQWIPEMDFKSGFTLIRDLGRLPSGELISAPALVAIHWIHRNFAFVVLLYMGTIAWNTKNIAGLAGPSKLILILLTAQLFTGLTTIFFQWPLVIAVMHNGGAAGLVLATVTLLVRLKRQAKLNRGIAP